MAASRATIAAYAGGLATVAFVVADERLDLRRYKRVAVPVPGGPTLSLNARTRPPPIGCCDWPSGRVLLHWAVQEGLCDTSATIIEAGAGLGTASIGLAAAARQRSNPGLSMVATDVCEETLSNMRANAAPHRFDDSRLRVCKWDAAGGQSAVDALPVPLATLTHLIGSDLVYSGFGGARGAEGGGPGGGGGEERLEDTLAALLRAKPSLRCTLLVEDRFSGGAVSALAGAAGVQHQSTTVDPAIARFEARCRELGLVIDKAPIPARVVESVSESQSIPERASWWIAGRWDGLQLLHISVAQRSQ